MCKKNQKGFTLAELLVVVAIIAVLAAIAIPVFGASTKKAKLAADDAMIREAYALVQYAKLTGEITYDGTTKTLSDFLSGGGFVGFLYFTDGGTLSADPGNAYKLKETDASCELLPVIPPEELGVLNDGHTEGNYITVWIHGSAETPSVSMFGMTF